MLHATIRFWRLSPPGERNLGLCCTEDGLFLGRTPLIERRARHYVIRPRSDLDRLVKRFPAAPDLDRLLPGLGVVKSALDERNLCLAQIAAVQLRVPDLPDLRARAEIESEDRLIKAERGASILMRGGWDPDEHPRAGVPPNPGWFAPTGVSGSEVAQSDENERELEDMRDPLAEVRQAQWDARIDILRRLDPSNPNLVYAGPPGAPSTEAVARLDAEVRNVARRVADKIANGHAWARHAAEFPELSSRSQFAGEIDRVISNSASTVRALRDGRTAYYENSTHTLVVVNPEAPDWGTAFRPKRKSDYLNELR